MQRIQKQELQDENGQKMILTRIIDRVLKKEYVNHSVAHRKTFKKFGDCKGFPSGPDPNSTQLGDEVFLKLTTNPLDLVEKQETKIITQKVGCRNCQGDHYTAKCPYRDTYDASQQQLQQKSVATPGKYVPLHMRGGKPSEPSERKRDDSNTIRIANLSEDTTDNDVRALVERFGPVSRVFVAKDINSRVCKGFAFVSFYDKADAQLCIDKLDGFGYDSLILKVDFAQRN